MKITYGVNVPRPRGKARAEGTVAFVDFMLSGEQSMKMDFENDAAVKKAYYAIQQYVYRNRLGDQYIVVKKGNAIYVGRNQ